MYLKKAFCAVPLFVYAVSAFSLEFFSPGRPISVNELGGASVTFIDAPYRVTVKLALQNPDNSLTSIESSALYNVIPATLTTIRIPSDITPAINYFIIAIDSSNPDNYASMGPFVINGQGLGSYPSTSSTVKSGTTYATGAHSATATVSKPTVTGSPSTPTGSTSKPASTDQSPTPPNGGSYTSLPFPAIIGIAVGCGLAVSFFVIFMVIWCCCLKREIKLISSVASANQPNSMNKNSSTLPMTSPSVTYSPTKNQTNINKPKPSPKQSKPPPPSTPTFASGNPPSYPQQQQQFQYPNEIGMPVPVHHFGDSTAYSSPTFNNDYNPFHEQKSYYPEQWPVQQPFSPTMSKLEVTPKGSVLSQKVEYDGITADNKVEYIQNPDDQEEVFQKPNAAEHEPCVYKNKLNRRSI